MSLNNLSKQELIAVLHEMKEILDDLEKNRKSKPSAKRNSRNQAELESLIGTVPFLLHNRQIFERNQDIADFAERLNIKVPSPEKKKREDIIGRIVSAIVRFDSQKIKQLNRAVESMKKSDIKKGKTNFFSDWEQAIKNMKIS